MNESWARQEDAPTDLYLQCPGECDPLPHLKICTRGNRESLALQ